jgi:hypothetical protein
LDIRFKLWLLPNIRDKAININAIIKMLLNIFFILFFVFINYYYILSNKSLKYNNWKQPSLAVSINQFYYLTIGVSPFCK